MKAYHSIQKYNKDHIGKSIFSFEKIDGSNIRAEWSRKLSKKSSFTNGFSKFGTRNQLIQKNSPFEEAICIFNNKYAEDLDKIFRENKIFNRIEKVTVYGEFFGKNSFAGQHDWNEDHDLIIFDVFFYKKDYLSPANFLKVFDSIKTPLLKYTGPLTEEYIRGVEDEEGEGHVYKGVDNDKVFMGKIKTIKWLDKVKELYGEKIMNEY